MFNRIKRIGGPAAALVCIVLAAGCPAAPGKGGTREPIPDLKREIFVLNSLAETVSIINPDAVRDPDGLIAADDHIEYGAAVDLEKKPIYNDVFLVGKWPNHILHYDGKLYITSSGENIVEVYDETSFAWIGRIDLGTNSNPWMTVRKEGTSKGYVVNFAAGDVAVVDLDTREVLERIPAGSGPEGAAYLNGRLFICNTNWNQQEYGFDTGTVTVIDTVNDEVEETIELGETETNPQSVLALPDQDEIHVVCTGKNGGDDSNDGVIVVVDADPGSPGFLTITGRYSVGGSPVYSEGGLDSARGRAYLSGVGGITAYDYTTGAVEPVLTADDQENDLFAGTIYDESSDIIFAADFTHDRVLALDGSTYEVLAEIRGSDGVQSPVLTTE
ncbi:MAG: YncE family protein [Spirochaetota bacterium]